jgi:hypothetical protein
VRVLAIHVLLLAQQLYFHESAEQLTLERAGSLPSGGELALRASMKVHDDIERSEQLLETLRRSSGLIST